MFHEATVEAEGLEDLEKELEEMAGNMDDSKVLDAMEQGADQLVNDIRALPRPRSMLGGGHTHMLDSVGSQRGKDVVDVGWGKYYGKMVENGHKSRKGRWVAAQPHMSTTFEKNKDRYYKTMLDALKLNSEE